MSKSVFRADRFILARIGVLRLAKKPYAKMTDKELVKRLFPKDVRKQLKTVLLELNFEGPKRRKAKKQQTTG